MPELSHLLETALFVEDLSRASAFYREVMGLAQFLGDERGCGFLLPGGPLLLLVKQGVSREPNVTPGGVVPPCGTSGSAHLAFAVSAEELKAWRSHLARHRVEVLSEVAWQRGGRSLYFHDPDGHLLELATPGVWEVY